MSTTIAPAVRWGVRRSFRCLAFLFVGLACSAWAQAAPSLTATLAASAVGQGGEFGTIKGRLVWGGDNIPPVKVLQAKGKAEKEPNVCAKDAPILSRELIVDPKTKGVSYAFAYISRPKGENPEAVKKLLAAHPKLELDQKNCEFVPYLTAMHQDQKLVVKSTDPTNHNVRLVAFTNQGLNQNVAAGGELALNLVAESRPVSIRCDIHPWMRSYVMVFDHPFFAITGKDGSFEIQGVPAGTQNLMLWQENVGYVTKDGKPRIPVQVEAGKVTDVGELVLDPAKVKPAS